MYTLVDIVTDETLVSGLPDTESVLAWAGEHLRPTLFWCIDVLLDGQFVTDLDRFSKGGTQ